MEAERPISAFERAINDGIILLDVADAVAENFLVEVWNSNIKG